MCMQTRFEDYFESRIVILTNISLLQQNMLIIGYIWFAHMIPLRIYHKEKDIIKVPSIYIPTQFNTKLCQYF